MYFFKTQKEQQLKAQLGYLIQGRKLLSHFFSVCLCFLPNFYATEMYIMHFLGPTQILNAPDLTGQKVNVLYDTGLAQRPPPTPHQGRKVFGP